MANVRTWSDTGRGSVALARLGRVAGTLAAALVTAACSSSSSGTSTPADAGHSDASALDGSTVDGGGSPEAAPEPEAGAVDAGPDTSFLDSDAGPVSLTNLPAHGAYLGAFVDVLTPAPDAGTDTASEGRFVAAEAQISRKWAIDNRFYNDSTDFVADRTQWDIANHIVPLITWMPYGTGNGDPLVEYILGQHDAMVHAEAQKAKALGVQIFMRWGHEMNGNWYPWGGSNTGSAGTPDDAGVSDGGGGDAGVTVPSSGPAKYVAAWRHVHDIFVQEGATNVLWMWTPNVVDVPQVPWNHWTSYYPGDAYVDWVGIDVYNWGTSSSCCIWESFAGLMTGSPYQDYSATKPIALPEIGSTEVGGSKAAWLDAMHQNLTTEFQKVRAVVWFDINKETNWNIDSSPSALASFRAMALDPYFNP